MAEATSFDRTQSVRSIAERIGEKIGLRATSQSIFGSPIEKDGVTVIPIGKVRYGFGGGGGTDKEGDEGGGGGGGMRIAPVGYIELSGGKSQFKRIHEPASLALLGLTAGASLWFVLRGIRAISQTS